MNLSQTFSVASIALATLSVLPAQAVSIDLVGDVWDVSGEDIAGNTWDESTLVFTSQTSNGDDDLVEGYFDWLGNNGSFGRELFSGTLFSDLSLTLDGFELVPPIRRIITSNYTAQVTPDGNQIINGSWGGNGNGIPSDDWSAVRVAQVPESDISLPVFILSLSGLLISGKLRHSGTQK